MNAAAHLLIDAGNTRIKWRLWTPASGWSDADPQGSATLTDLPMLAHQWAGLHCSQALLVCVASEEVYAQLLAALRRTDPALAVRRIVPGTNLCGVVNDYRQPAQLGADRWVQAIGGHALYPGRALVLVSMGTATTIDVVLPIPGAAGQARFRGGVILPGVELMRAALAQGTARLPLATGRYMAIADNTDDAIIGGILHAQAGAIERLCRAVRADPHWPPGLGQPLCLVGGGAAAPITALLNAPEFPAPTRLHGDLVLRGLAHIAQHNGAAG